MNIQGNAFHWEIYKKTKEAARKENSVSSNFVRLLRNSRAISLFTKWSFSAGGNHKRGASQKQAQHLYFSQFGTQNAFPLNNCIVAVAWWLRHYATGRKVAGSRPHMTNAFFQFT
jgi:hypothetical protein